MKDEKKDNVILIAGFVLIVFVIVFTVLRNTIFSNSNKENNDKTTQALDTIKAPSYQTISALDLNKKILAPNKEEKFTMLDVRPFNSYISKHIVDSLNIAISEFPVGTKISPDNLIVVIGENSDDKDIETSVNKLKQENFKNIIVLAGGMDSWNQLIGTAVNYGDPKSFADQSKVSYLDPSSLNDALTQKVPVYIIDVRPSNEFSGGHITGAKNIPIDELEKRRREITESKVVVVGSSELQEFQAAVQMADMIIVSPFVMRTAMPGWVEKKFTLVR